jgi:dTDP-4-dehydrorhamnose 3,5-epimerase
MSVTVEKGPIEGLLLIQPKVFRDSRGYFLETWNEDDCRAAGLLAHFVQDQQS